MPEGFVSHGRVSSSPFLHSGHHLHRRPFYGWLSSCLCPARGVLARGHGLCIRLRPCIVDMVFLFLSVVLESRALLEILSRSPASLATWLTPRSPSKTRVAIRCCGLSWDGGHNLMLRHQLYNIHVFRCFRNLARSFRCVCSCYRRSCDHRQRM